MSAKINSRVSSGRKWKHSLLFSSIHWQAILRPSTLITHRLFDFNRTNTIISADISRARFWNIHNVSTQVVCFFTFTSSHLWSQFKNIENFCKSNNWTNKHKKRLKVVLNIHTLMSHVLLFFSCIWYDHVQEWRDKIQETRITSEMWMYGFCVEV